MHTDVRYRYIQRLTHVAFQPRTHFYGLQAVRYDEVAEFTRALDGSRRAYRFCVERAVDTSDRNTFRPLRANKGS